MSRLFICGDSGIAHEPGRHYPGRDWRVFTGWGATWCVASEREAWTDLAAALDGRGYSGLAIAALERARSG